MSPVSPIVVKCIDLSLLGFWTCSMPAVVLVAKCFLQSPLGFWSCYICWVPEAVPFRIVEWLHVSCSLP